MAWKEAPAMTWKWWAGGGVLLLAFLLGRYSVKAPMEVKTVEVVKWKTVEKIKTLPGSTTTLRPDGSTVISGPVEIGRQTEGDRSLSSVSKPLPPSWHALVSASLLYPRPSWGCSLTFRIGEMLTLPIGAVVGAEGPLTTVIPNRASVGLALSF